MIGPASPGAGLHPGVSGWSLRLSLEQRMSTHQQLTVTHQSGGSFLFKGCFPGQETPELSVEGTRQDTQSREGTAFPVEGRVWPDTWTWDSACFFAQWDYIRTPDQPSLGTSEF